MRYFKKEGNMKLKKSEDTKLIEGWLKDGFVEVSSNGGSVESKKSTSSSKKD